MAWGLGGHGRVVFRANLAFAGASVLGLAGATAYTVKGINFQRSRYWSDSFTMTPEALRMPYEKVTDSLTDTSIHPSIHLFKIPYRHLVSEPLMNHHQSINDIHLVTHIQYKVSFTTSDGVVLSGWFVRQTHRGEPSRRVVVCCNPYNHDRSTMLGICRGLWDASYSVMLFNFRSHSDAPTRQTIGHLEVEDVRAALKWIRSNKPENARIGFLGASMGGAMTLKMAEENDDIVACATDCAFTTLWDVISHRIQLEMPLLFKDRPLIRGYFMELINFSNKLCFHYDLKKVGPGALDAKGENQLKKITCPLLIVHSENDSIVPVSCAGDIYKHTSTPDSEKEMVILPQVEHIGSYFQDEYRYIKRFVNFFDDKFERMENNSMVKEKEIVDNANGELPVPVPVL